MKRNVSRPGDAVEEKDRVGSTVFEMTFGRERNGTVKGNWCQQLCESEICRGKRMS